MCVEKIIYLKVMLLVENISHAIFTYEDGKTLIKSIFFSFGLEYFQ